MSDAQVSGDTARSIGGVAADGAPGAAWRYAAGGAVPAMVVRPRTTAEVASVIAAARADGLAVIGAGKGARLGIGNRPRRYDIAVTTDHLDAIERHVAEDLTVTAQAGVTLEQLNEELGRSGQWLPLDPAVGGETTIGGLIAADACGPLRHSHGKVRDFLLGIELVNGSAEVVRGGGRVVKNVAGYDVPKLLCGSFGTLGVITSATFKTRPRPAAEALYLGRCAGVAAAVQLALAIDCSAGAVAFADALSEGACEAIGIDGAAALVVGVAGSQAEVDAESERLRGHALAPCEAARAASIAMAVRNSALPMNDDALVGRFAVLPARLPALLARVEAEAVGRGLVVETAAHAAAGVARCQIAGDGERAALFAEWLRMTVRVEGGWVVYEAIPDGLRARVEAWGMSGAAVRLMRGVKRVFDPDGIFSPGRFVGGI